MRNILFVIAAAGLSSGALAQEAAQPAAKPVKEKKVCKSLDKTGSMLGERTCMTKSEWESFDAKNAADAERFARGRDAAKGHGGATSSGN